MALKIECAGARRWKRWLLRGVGRSVNASLIKCPKRKHRYSSLLMDKVLHRPILPTQKYPHQPQEEAPQENPHELPYSLYCFLGNRKFCWIFFFGNLESEMEYLIAVKNFHN